jgi:hypothetical protein
MDKGDVVAPVAAAGMAGAAIHPVGDDFMLENWKDAVTESFGTTIPYANRAHKMTNKIPVILQGFIAGKEIIEQGDDKVIVACQELEQKDQALVVLETLGWVVTGQTTIPKKNFYLERCLHSRVWMGDRKILYQMLLFCLQAMQNKHVVPLDFTNDKEASWAEIHSRTLLQPVSDLRQQYVYHNLRNAGVLLADVSPYHHYLHSH